MKSTLPLFPGRRPSTSTVSSPPSSLSGSGPHLFAPPAQHIPAEEADKVSPTGVASQTICEIFWQAMSEGNVERVLDLLRMFGPELCDSRAVFPHASSGETPLHCAANNSNEDLAASLISLGANVNAQDATGATPLHCAIVGESLSVANLLLSNNARVDIPDSDGHLPLHDAVWRGSLEAVKIVLVDGHVSSLDAGDKRGRTPVALAWKFKFDAAVELMAEYRREQEVLHGMPSISQLALSVASDGEVGAGSVEEAHRGPSRAEPSTLSSTGSEFRNYNPQNPTGSEDSNLDRSASSGRPTASSLATNFDLDPVSMMEVAIAYSGMDSNCDLMLELIEAHGEEVTKYHATRRGGQTCLHRAAHHGRTDVLRAALAAAAEIDARETTYNSTALTAAAAAGRDEAVELLVREGADVEAMTEFGTPMHYAAYHGRLSTVRLLLNLGADIHAENADRRTPRALAKARKYTAIARMLKHGRY